MAKKQKTKEEKYENIRNLISESIVIGLLEYDKVKKKRRKGDSDLISTSEACKVRPESRVRKLIKAGYLKQKISGNTKTSTRFVSKKRLIDLDKLQNI